MQSSFAHEKNLIRKSNEREVREEAREKIVCFDVVNYHDKKRDETDNLHDETESGGTGSETSFSSNDGVNDVIDYELSMTRNINKISPQKELIFPATIFTISEMILASRSIEAWKLSLKES